MKIEQKAPEMTSRRFNNSNNNNVSSRRSNNTNNSSYNTINNCKNNKAKNNQRIWRPCMTQAIKPMTIATTATTIKRNDCNYCKNKDHPHHTNTWEEVLSIHSKDKSDRNCSSPESSTRKQNQLNLHLFDPYHVLQFLLFELNLKLKFLLPDDKSIYKILSEIQQTMKRFEMTSTKTAFTASNNLMMSQENRVKKSNSSCQTDNYNLLHRENFSQTINDDNDFIEFNANNRFSIEAQIKQNYEKLKENCNTLEKACAALQEEKCDIHDTLSKCYNEIAMLKTEISCLQIEMKEASTREKCTSKVLEEQCKCLQDELKTLQEFLSRQVNELTIVESLNKKLKESSEKINALQKSRFEHDKALILTKLEKEKLMIIQNYRENQMNALQKDITDVCHIIQEQLDNLRNDDNDKNIIQQYTKNENRNFGKNQKHHNNYDSVLEGKQNLNLNLRKRSKNPSLKFLHKGKMLDSESSCKLLFENLEKDQSKNNFVNDSVMSKKPSLSSSSECLHEKQLMESSSLSSIKEEGKRQNNYKSKGKLTKFFDDEITGVNKRMKINNGNFYIGDQHLANKKSFSRTLRKLRRNEIGMNVDNVIQNSQTKNFKQFLSNNSTDISFDLSCNEEENEEEYDEEGRLLSS